jgi:hypothetical protein
MVGVTVDVLRNLRRRECYPTSAPKISKSDKGLIGRLCLCFPIETIRSCIGDEALADELLNPVSDISASVKEEPPEWREFNPPELHTMQNEKVSLQLANSVSEITEKTTSLNSNDLSCKLGASKNYKEIGHLTRGGCR